MYVWLFAQAKFFQETNVHLTGLDEIFDFKSAQIEIFSFQIQVDFEI